MKKLILCLLFFCWGFLAFAEDTLIIELPDINVEAAKNQVPSPAQTFTPLATSSNDRGAVSQTVINVEPLARPVSTAFEEISRSVGINVKRYGGLGDFATFSLRGSNFSQVNLYLDGVPLSQASTFINLGDINAANLERIEIYRGGAPLGFGQSAIGGAINLVPRQSLNKLSADLKFITGSFGTGGFNLLTTYGGEKYSSVLGIGQLHSLGNFSYKDDHGTPLEKGDDRIVTRKNNALDQLDLFGSVSFWGKWGKLKAAHYYYQKHKGMPGLGSYQSESARFFNEFNQSSLSYQRSDILERRVDWEAKVFYAQKVDAFYDPDGEIGLGRTNDHNLTISNGASSLFLVKLPQIFQELSALIETNAENYFPSDLWQPRIAASHISRQTTNLVLADECRLFQERFSLHPSWRLENSLNDFHGEVPFASHGEAPDNQKRYLLASRSLGWAVKPLAWLKIKGNWAQNYRLPNFTELFGSKGTILGNSDLKPEKSQNRDVGIQVRGAEWWWVDNWLLESSYYLNEVENLINFEANSQNTTIANNISQARLEGVEFNGQVTLLHHFNQSLNVTYQQARDASDIPYYHGNRLPNRPLYEINSHSEIFGENWKTFFEVNQITRNYLDRANLHEVENRIIENAGVTYAPFKHISFSVEVKNLTDNQVADVAGYPLPGRGYFTSLNINF